MNEHSITNGRRRVLVSGASIAGLTIACWLNRFGFDVTVVERAATVRSRSPSGWASCRCCGTRTFSPGALLSCIRMEALPVPSGPKN
ncbi:NAD-binding protein [Janthinobacterium sp. PC23-8]|uniref:FAD-dependent oxidoreductase n=1 Tax=Janthinobacterium sp. PC23-8 TaxID=2012679 RepID=UPI0015959DB4